MIGIGIVVLGLLAALGALAAAVGISPYWWFAALPLTLVGALGVWGLVQRRHSVLRNYPVLGHAHFLMKRIRPELRQYFIERNYDGRPFDRDVRRIVYERAKGTVAVLNRLTAAPAGSEDARDRSHLQKAREFFDQWRTGQARLAGRVSGIRVTDPAEVGSAVRRAFGTPGPVLLDVLTNPEEIAVPAKPTAEQDWGFAVAKMKEVVRGHGERSGD